MKKQPLKTSKIEYEDLLEMIRDNYKIKHIAKKFKITPKNVYDIAKRENITLSNEPRKDYYDNHLSYGLMINDYSNKYLIEEEVRKHDRQQKCSHLHWVKKCSVCGKIIDSEVTEKQHNVKVCKI